LFLKSLYHSTFLPLLHKCTLANNRKKKNAALKKGLHHIRRSRTGGGSFMRLKAALPHNNYLSIGHAKVLKTHYNLLKS
jgi:hypothetical protein